MYIDIVNKFLSIFRILIWKKKYICILKEDDFIFDKGVLKFYYGIYII